MAEQCRQQAAAGGQLQQPYAAGHMVVDVQHTSEPPAGMVYVSPPSIAAPPVGCKPDQQQQPQQQQPRLLHVPPVLGRFPSPKQQQGDQNHQKAALPVQQQQQQQQHAAPEQHPVPGMSPLQHLPAVLQAAAGHLPLQQHYQRMAAAAVPAAWQQVLAQPQPPALGLPMLQQQQQQAQTHGQVGPMGFVPTAPMVLPQAHRVGVTDTPQQQQQQWSLAGFQQQAMLMGRQMAWVPPSLLQQAVLQTGLQQLSPTQAGLQQQAVLQTGLQQLATLQAGLQQVGHQQTGVMQLAPHQAALVLPRPLLLPGAVTAPGPGPTWAQLQPASHQPLLQLLPQGQLLLAQQLQQQQQQQQLQQQQQQQQMVVAAAVVQQQQQQPLGPPVPLQQQPQEEVLGAPGRGLDDELWRYPAKRRRTARAAVPGHTSQPTHATAPWPAAAGIEQQGLGGVPGAGEEDEAWRYPPRRKATYLKASSSSSSAAAAAAEGQHVEHASAGSGCGGGPDAAAAAAAAAAGPAGLGAIGQGAEADAGMDGTVLPPPGVPPDAAEAVEQQQQSQQQEQQCCSHQQPDEQQHAGGRAGVAQTAMADASHQEECREAEQQPVRRSARHARRAQAGVPSRCGTQPPANLTSRSAGDEGAACRAAPQQQQGATSGAVGAGGGEPAAEQLQLLDGSSRAGGTDGAAALEIAGCLATTGGSSSSSHVSGSPHQQVADGLSDGQETRPPGQQQQQQEVQQQPLADTAGQAAACKSDPAGDAMDQEDAGYSYAHQLLQQQPMGGDTPGTTATGPRQEEEMLGDTDGDQDTDCVTHDTAPPQRSQLSRRAAGLGPEGVQAALAAVVFKGAAAAYARNRRRPVCFQLPEDMLEEFEEHRQQQQQLWEQIQEQERQQQEWEALRQQQEAEALRRQAELEAQQQREEQQLLLAELDKQQVSEEEHDDQEDAAGTDSDGGSDAAAHSQQPTQPQWQTRRRLRDLGPEAVQDALAAVVFKGAAAAYARLYYWRPVCFQLPEDILEECEEHRQQQQQQAEEQQQQFEHEQQLQVEQQQGHQESTRRRRQQQQQQQVDATDEEEEEEEEAREQQQEHGCRRRASHRRQQQQQQQGHWRRQQVHEQQQQLVRQRSLQTPASAVTAAGRAHSNAAAAAAAAAVANDEGTLQGAQAVQQHQTRRSLKHLDPEAVQAALAAVVFKGAAVAYSRAAFRRPVEFQLPEHLFESEEEEDAGDSGGEGIGSDQELGPGGRQQQQAASSSAAGGGGFGHRQRHARGYLRCSSPIAQELLADGAWADSATSPLKGQVKAKQSSRGAAAGSSRIRPGVSSLWGQRPGQAAAAMRPLAAAGRGGVGLPPLAPRRTLAGDIAAAAAVSAGVVGAGSARPTCSGTTSSTSGRAWLPFRPKGDPAILQLQEQQHLLLEQQQVSGDGGEQRLSDRLASRGQAAPRDVLPPPINLKPKKRISSWCAAGFVEAVAKGLVDIGLTWVPDAYDSTGYTLGPVQQQRSKGVKACKGTGSNSSSRSSPRTGKKQQQARQLATVVEMEAGDKLDSTQQQHQQLSSSAAQGGAAVMSPDQEVTVGKGGPTELFSSSRPWEHMVAPPSNSGRFPSIPAVFEAGQPWGPASAGHGEKALLLQPAAVPTAALPGAGAAAAAVAPTGAYPDSFQQHKQQQQGPPPPSVAGPTAQLVVLVLLHEAGWPTAAVWEEWERLHGGSVAVVCHYKEGAPLTGDIPGVTQIQARMCGTRVPARWGDISLTAAILQCGAELAASYPRMHHMAIVSGHDIPLRSLAPGSIPLGATCFCDFRFGAWFEADAAEAAVELLQEGLGMEAGEAGLWAKSLTFHHTWMVLARPLLLALLSQREELLRVGAALNDRFMQEDAAVAADEFLLITAAKRYGWVCTVQRGRLETQPNGSKTGAAGGSGRSVRKMRVAAARKRWNSVRQQQQQQQLDQQQLPTSDSAELQQVQRQEEEEPQGEQATGRASSSSEALEVVPPADCMTQQQQQQQQQQFGDEQQPAALPVDEDLLLPSKTADLSVAVLQQQQQQACNVQAGSDGGSAAAAAGSIPADGNSGSGGISMAAGDAMLPCVGLPSPTAEVAAETAAEAAAGGDHLAGSPPHSSGCSALTAGAVPAAAEGAAGAAAAGALQETSDGSGISDDRQQAAVPAPADCSVTATEAAITGAGAGSGLPVSSGAARAAGHEEGPAAAEGVGAAGAAGGSPAAAADTAAAAAGMGEEEDTQEATGSATASATPETTGTQGATPAAAEAVEARHVGSSRWVGEPQPADPVRCVAPTTRLSAGGGGRGGPGRARKRGKKGSAAVPPLGEPTLPNSTLLDCCPTLALFHPTSDRHPHTWRTFRDLHPCHVQPWGRGAVTVRDLDLFAALKMARPNGALFFRKVALEGAQQAARLDHILQLLWQGRGLPKSLDGLGPANQ